MPRGMLPPPAAKSLRRNKTAAQALTVPRRLCTSILTRWRARLLTMRRPPRKRWTQTHATPERRVRKMTKMRKMSSTHSTVQDSTESTQVVRGARRSSVAVSRKRPKRYAGVYKRRCVFRRVCYAKKHENRQHCVCSFVFAVAPSFARNMTMDVLAGNAIDFAKVTAETTYKADGGVTNCDYIAHFITAGCLFTSAPVGLYFRGGATGVASLKRTAADVTRRLNAGGYGGNFDVGAAFAIPLGAFFLNIALAFSIFYIAAEHTRWKWPKNTCYEESFEDDVFGVGITANVYVKYRRKNFVCAVGLLPHTIQSHTFRH